MFKLAIFDLDGTLLNTIDDLADACNYALRLGGFREHPVEAYRLFVGNGVYNLIRRALPEGQRDEETAAAVKAAFDRYYRDHSQDKTRPYGGVVEMLAALRAEGVDVAVLSNKPDGFVKTLVEQYFPGAVDYAAGQREDVPIKPDPQAVFAILERLGRSAEEAVYIGDSDVDVKTGNNAGLYTVGVGWGFRTKDELQNAGKCLIVDKVEQLQEIIIDKR